MMPKLTARMDKVIKLSQRIARDYGQEYVGTEHMLLAILAEGSGMACEILQDAGIDLRRAKEVVDKLMRSALEDTWVFGRLPGTPHFRNVIEGAIEEARRFNSGEVSAEFLLVALSREDGSVAHNALTEMGIGADQIHAEIARRRGTSQEGCEDP
ncbi:MAG: Clp protease N-terminal domain-containing protein [Phycisphaerae bacterium]